MRLVGRLLAHPLGLFAGIIVLLAAAGVLLARSTPSATGWWVGLGLGVTGLLALPLVTLGWRHTERTRALQAREHELDAQREALLQLVSHEIRTPLTVIRGSVDTLLRRPGEVSSSAASLLEATDRAATRLEQMMEVLLAGADELGPGSSQPGPVDLGEVVRHAAATVHRTLPDRLELDLDLDVTLITVEPDLWLVLRCLLDNAARFGPTDAAITVSARHEERVVVIRITDRGPGLPRGFGERAFAAFTQADSSTARPHAGMGMGLYTARRLARRLGGELLLRDADTCGTVAELVLPVAPAVLELDAAGADPCGVSPPAAGGPRPAGP